MAQLKTAIDVLPELVFQELAKSEDAFEAVAVEFFRELLESKRNQKGNLHIGVGNRADLRFQLLHPRVVADPLVVDHFETSVVLI